MYLFGAKTKVSTGHSAFVQHFVNKDIAMGRPVGRPAQDIPFGVPAVLLNQHLDRAAIDCMREARQLRRGTWKKPEDYTDAIASANQGLRHTEEMRFKPTFSANAFKEFIEYTYVILADKYYWMLFDGINTATGKKGIKGLVSLHQQGHLPDEILERLKKDHKDKIYAPGVAEVLYEIREISEIDRFCTTMSGLADSLSNILDMEARNPGLIAGFLDDMFSR